MVEIGSEFWKADVKETQNELFPADTKWFLSGQNALNYIISDIQKKHDIHTVALPSWCCDSMVIPFSILEFDINFYPVSFENGLLKQEIDKNCDVILVLDYFGYSSEYDYSSYPGIVIRDMTHSLFSKKYNDAEYYFGSLRKWTGVYTGGYAWSKNTWKTEAVIQETDKDFVLMRRKAMELKADYISGKNTKKDFLTYFNNAEDILDMDNLHGIFYAEQSDIIAAQKLDVHFIKKQRRKNAQILLDVLSDLAMFPVLGENDCPLFVPIMVEERDKLKNYLIQNQIYCPSHWPLSKLHKLNAETIMLYKHELSLVCDQRYTKDEMEVLAAAIVDFIR